MGEAIVFTSGKGGVGKTTAIANIGAGLSLLDKKVIMLDTDMGLRNLDMVMGLENHIHYHLMDILEERCRISQAMIRDKRYPNLFLIPAAPEAQKLKQFHSQFHRLIQVLKQEFDFVLIDCPAGIEDGFSFAVSSVDRAVVVTTPHISAVHDAAKVLQILGQNRFLPLDLLINSMNARMVRKKQMLAQKEIEDILEHKAIGCVSYDEKIIVSQNHGIPVISMKSKCSREWRMVAYRLSEARIIPLDLEHEVPRMRDAHYAVRKEPDYEAL